MIKTDVENIIAQEPLLMGDISRAFIHWESLLSTSHPSLFFGVGLCTSKEAAVAIPFDILSFFLLAEKLRRLLKLGRVFVLIADTHARTNAFMTEEIVRNLTNKTRTIFTTMIRNLRLNNFQIILSSDIRKNSEFQKLLQSVPSLPNEYLRHEIADLMWFTQHHNVRLKLGWSINNDPIPQGHDERFFDAQIRDTKALPLSFLHCKAGRTFDPNRPKASPYISVQGESRVILAKGEQVKLPNNTDVARATGNHLASIVRVFESLFIRIPKPNLEEKIQFMIDLSTHG